MGSANSTLPTPETDFAFLVTKDAYDRDVSITGTEIVVTPELMTKYRTIYDAALKEYALPLGECQSPTVVRYKYQQILTEEERKAFVETVVASAIDREKKRERANKEKAKKEVFDDKSFSGTKEDSQAEKEAAAILRGTSGGSNTAIDDYENFPLLQPPGRQGIDDDQQLVLRSVSGMWRKFLGASQCYMYIHTLSRQIVSLRPEDFEEEVVAATTEAVVDPSNGLPTVEVSDIPVRMHHIIVEMQKTPLILDTTKEQVARTFYAYKGICEDVSSLVVPFGKSGVKRQDVVERLRKSLVGAMKSGMVFALYLGEVAIEHADWKKKLCSKDAFPVEVFQNGGAKLLQPDYDPRYKKLYRPEDLEHGEAIVREGFQVVVISTLSPFVYQSKLEDSIPLGYMNVVYVVHPQ